MNTLIFRPSFLVSLDRNCSAHCLTLTCEDATSSRSRLGIRQLASPRKHIRMWSTSAQCPTVSIRTVSPPRRTTTVFRTTWLLGWLCCSSAQPKKPALDGNIWWWNRLVGCFRHKTKLNVSYKLNRFLERDLYYDLGVSSFSHPACTPPAGCSR